MSAELKALADDVARDLEALYQGELKAEQDQQQDPW